MTEATEVRPPAGEGLDDLVDRYLSGWNETDAQERMTIIEQAWEPDCRLVDPPIDGSGHAGVNAVVEALHAHYPDHRFHRIGEVDGHHDAFRVDWELRGPGGEVALAGTDYGLVGASGRVARVTGFFDGGRPS